MENIFLVVQELGGHLIFETIGDIVNLILTNPYLLIGVSLMLIGAGVSFLKRLIRV